ncbi:MAG: hypothetical protein IPH75_08000 [bacterium]|nr:hypothetical protein [bacterium]
MSSQPGLVKTIEVKDDQGRVVESKEVVTYAGLLNRAHQEGLKRVSTKLIQTPSAANGMTAISMAEVETDKGVFRDYGDASPDNVDSMIIPHIIRMSVTRAKARALRDAVNIGAVAIEELGAGFGNGVDNAGTKPLVGATGKFAQDPKHLAQGTGSNNGSGTGNDPMTEYQLNYLYGILAEHGVNGDDAQDYIIETVGAGSLSEVTKKEASDLIDELLANPLEMLRGVAVS